MQTVRAEKAKTHWPYLLFALSAIIIIRILPILKAPLSSYGYDYGFYYYAATHAANSSLSDILKNAVWGGYNNPLFLLAERSGIPSGILISELYFLFSVSLGLALYAWMKQKSHLAGIISAVLVAASTVQTSGYLMYFWKNILALPILLLGFAFLEQKKYWQLAVCALLVLALHRTTAVVFLLTIGIYGAWVLVKQKKYSLLAICVAILLLASLAAFDLLNLKPVILNLIYNKNSYVSSGLFLENISLFKLWWPFLLLGLPGLYFYLKKREHLVLPIFTALLVGWIILKLPFYRRMLLYLDISLLAFSAYFLGLIDYRPALRKATLGAIIILLLISSATFALHQDPVISRSETAEIKNFKSRGFILAVTANDAPWLLAYSEGSRLGAPGLFEDPHTFEEWRAFWAGQDQRRFISAYPRPLYFYQRSYRLPPGGISECLTQLTPNFSELNFKCLERKF